MSIICFNGTPGANKTGNLYDQDFDYYDWNNEHPSEKGKPMFGPHVYWTWEEYQGKCIREWENNGYDDSDFYMCVWDEETQAPKSICFATTRGWTYPSYGSFVDATPEVLQAYQAYETKRLRKNRICEKWENRKEYMRIAKQAGLANYLQVIKLSKVTPYGMWSNVVRLLTTNLRSSFRKSMREQIVNWVNDPAPKYNSPLSKRQWEYV